MIDIRDRQILIDGEPRLIVAGEVHYFRLARADWQDRIDKLKAAGGNAVASYIPWLWHEQAAGDVDLSGRTRPETDLGAFVDLCRASGLWFFARPGPFVMAELKNEGLPFRLYDEHPEIVPVTWDGKPVPTRTVDYLAPAFLEECRRWYAAVAGVLVPRLLPNGGNVIAIQLDNEIGMLSWVTNSPDLTDGLIADFWEWLDGRYGEEERSQRYPPDRFVPTARATGIRSPDDDYAARLMRDLGWYMRDRFARYVAALRGYAEEAGMARVPFVVNVHGTMGGSGAPFPIGIGQLSRAYTQAPGYLAGSDIYLGNLSLPNAAELYLINGFMAAVNRPEQPLASVEFECGEGDYDQSLAVRCDPSAADLKLRLCVAQGNRLVNLYLFAGGINPQLDEPIGDGNDRISFTGERHGVGAPVGPEGQLGTTYPRLARTVRGLMAVADKLAVAREEHDGVTLGFIPDSFMTESVYPESRAMTEIAANLAVSRGGGPCGLLARAMLTAGFRFGCIDVQDRQFGPERTPLLALASARFMDGALQAKLVDYLERGGQVLLAGEIPQADMEGAPCTVLSDRLGLQPLGERRASSRYHLSVTAHGWAAPRPELRVGWAQVFAPDGPDPLLRVYGTGEVCGFEAAVGEGRVIAFTAEIPCDVPLIEAALARLGAAPALAHGCPSGGVLMTSTATPAGERFVHVMNLDGFDKPLRLTDRGQELLPGAALTLPRREGLMLPFGVRLGDVVIVCSTAEIAAVAPDAITFRRTQVEEMVVLDTDRAVRPADGLDARQQGRRWTVRSRPAPGERVDGDGVFAVQFAAG